MIKCEVLTCNREGMPNLCERHQKLAQSDDYYVVICSKCKSILEIKKKKVPGHPKYIFKSKCKYDKLALL